MKWIIGGIIAFLVSIVAIAAYLGPNDLRSCHATPTERAPCQTVDAVVAISGGDTSARAGEAIRLYQNSWAKYIVFSGAASDKDSPSNAAVMRAQALEAGIAADAILIDQESKTTLQNAANTSTIFERNNINSVILVTSAYHQRRAYLEFDKYNSGSILNHPVASDNQWSSLWWLTPQGWWLAGGELAKIIAFYTGSTT